MRLFKLAAEAQRIRLAHLVEPLPHQPVRFLLAEQLQDELTG